MVNSAISILRHEHDLILRMLDATEEAAHQLQRNSSVPAERLAELAEFFQLFAEGSHHNKEENRLFPLLLMKNLPGVDAAIHMMVSQHNQGRLYVHIMAEAAEAYRRGGDTYARDRWADAARGYAVLMRQHVERENHVLFLVADNLLTEAEQRALAAAFEKEEEEALGPEARRRIRELTEKLTGELLTRQ